MHMSERKLCSQRTDPDRSEIDIDVFVYNEVEQSYGHQRVALSDIKLEGSRERKSRKRLQLSQVDDALRPKVYKKTKTRATTTVSGYCWHVILLQYNIT